MARGETPPYVGLRPYDASDADRFFGRATEAREITSLMFASRLLVVHGRAGVGKTSLLRAGVLASLSAEAAVVLPVGRPPWLSAFPTTLTPGYNPFSFALLSSWAPDRSLRAIPGLTVSQFLSGLPPTLDRYGEELPIVAVIDQFEAVFGDVPQWAPYREPFLLELARAVEDAPGLRLVLVMREDALGELLPYESRLSGSKRSRYRLGPLDPDAALEAVTRPLEPTGRAFAPGVAEELVDRLRTATIRNAVGEERTVRSDTVEPASLQVVCSSLWDALPDAVRAITVDHLQDHGDVGAVLTRFCADAVADVAARENVPRAAIWEWLESNFITDLGTRGTAYEGVASTAGMPLPVARAFEHHRILRAERRSGSVWFELLHDGLIEPIRRGAAQVAGRAAEVPAPQAYLRMAETALGDGMLSDAAEYAERAAEAASGDRRTLAEIESFLGRLALVQVRDEAGERAEALWTSSEQHYNRSAELFAVEQDARAVGRVLTSLGRLFLERRRFADAVDALQGAVQRLPGDSGAKMDLARALLGAGQPQAAVAEYGSVLVVAPEDVDALVARGVVAAEHGDPASALDDLDNALRQDPGLADRPDVTEARARARARMGTEG